MQTLFQRLTVLSVLAMCGATGAAAETPIDILQSFEAAARRGSTDLGGFSAQRGQAFFKSTHGREWSCVSCHTQNPMAVGRHAKTNKEIAPLAPSANTERFTRAGKVDKWFRRNCNDVLGRACTATEKGDVLSYLMSLGK